MAGRAQGRLPGGGGGGGGGGEQVNIKELSVGQVIFQEEQLGVWRFVA
jgi:hypothetical protein